MPLTVSTKNPNYFADENDKAVLLVGSHYWSNLQDAGTTYPPTKFNYSEYTDWMKDNNYNLMRLWNSAEQPYAGHSGTGNWYTDPLPYERTGPGLAADGKPKFDLTKLNQDYFDRLRERVIEAGNDGIYVSVMLFEGWSFNPKVAGMASICWRPSIRASGPC